MLVTGFKALHYNPKLIQDLGQVITPPYDVISKEDGIRFRSQSPYNFCHVDCLGENCKDYSSAAKLLTEWAKLNIICQDPYPSYYLYQQDYQLNGKQHRRRTLLCSVRLHEFSDRVIKPHENTHGKYKLDRLNQLRELKANLSPIFGMTKDPEGIISSHFERWMFRKPFVQATDREGTAHTLWREEERTSPEISKFFQLESIYIVDGHHRYESALAYAKEQHALGNSDHPASRALFSIANCYDPGLVVLPTHRRVRNANLSDKSLSEISKRFTLESISYENLVKFLGAVPATPKFGLFMNGKLYVATPNNWETQKEVSSALSMIPVYWSDEALLTKIIGIPETERSQKIWYEKNAPLLWEQKQSDDLIIFHATPSVAWVTKVADEGSFMPQKSTYFYPKLYSGLVYRGMQQY